MNKLKVGIIGTHYSGKTALCHQIVGELRSEGFLIDYVREAARNSYYLASGEFSFAMQLDILNRQVSEELEILRTSSCIICDRTVIDVLAYSKQLQQPKDELTKTYKRCIEVFVSEYVKTYNVLFLKTDYFDTYQSNDSLVTKDYDFQLSVYETIKTILDKLNLQAIQINNNNGLETVINWIKKWDEKNNTPNN